MDWSERMNSAIEYIETNLSGEIDVALAAKKANCSSFHFQRMFFVVIGATVGGYIRRRRLTLAATELSSTDVKVMDVALNYGYDSPAAFARAFRQVHGLSPQEARTSGVKLVAYPKVSFHITLTGGNDMDYKIIEKPAFDVIGKSEKFTAKDGDNATKIPKWAAEFYSSHEAATLFRLNGDQLGPVTRGNSMGLCFDYEGMEDSQFALGVKNLHQNVPAGMEEFRFAIAVEKIGDTIPAGFEVIHIPSATWAVFDSFGPTPETMQELSKRIWGEWFLSTGYEYSGVMDFEVYFPGDPKADDYHGQIWVPVKKK